MELTESKSTIDTANEDGNYCEMSLISLFELNANAVSKGGSKDSNEQERTKTSKRDRHMCELT